MDLGSLQAPTNINQKKIQTEKNNYIHKFFLLPPATTIALSPAFCSANSKFFTSKDCALLRPEKVAFICFPLVPCLVLLADLPFLTLLTWDWSSTADPFVFCVWFLHSLLCFCFCWLCWECWKLPWRTGEFLFRHFLGLPRPLFKLPESSLRCKRIAKVYPESNHS